MITFFDSLLLVFHNKSLEYDVDEHVENVEVADNNKSEITVLKKPEKHSYNEVRF